MAGGLKNGERQHPGVGCRSQMHALLSAPLSAAPVFLAYPNPLTIWIPTGTISLVFHEFNSYMTTSGLKKKKEKGKSTT